MPTKLLISELLPNPSGTDSPFEYVELIATETINFSVTPYTVVFANNGTATPDGWVSGGGITLRSLVRMPTGAIGDHPT